MKKYFILLIYTISLAAMDRLPQQQKLSLSKRISNRLAKLFCINTYEHDVSDERIPSPLAPLEPYIPISPSRVESEKSE